MVQKAVVCALLVAIGCVSSGCRGARINSNEERIEKLEVRVTALEAQVMALQRK